MRADKCRIFVGRRTWAGASARIDRERRCASRRGVGSAVQCGAVQPGGRWPATACRPGGSRPRPSWSLSSCWHCRGCTSSISTASIAASSRSRTAARSPSANCSTLTTKSWVARAAGLPPTDSSLPPPPVLLPPTN